jgi:energy-coupling factor transporter ATP-binding protein EcfA2
MTNFLYNPDRKSREQLIAEFVVRNHALDEIMDDLESSDMKTPEQHYLLVGQRGSGKTTLLTRIKYAIEDSEKLKDWLIPVIFSEEQYYITELANLWENVAEVLEDYHGFKGLTSEMEKFIERENFEELAYEVLEGQLKKHKKKIVLLIDNIPDLLRKLEMIEVRRLREILQSRPYLRLVSGSTFYLDSLVDYRHPLFGFLRVVRLDGLTESETQTLLRKLGEVYNEQEKINAIITERPERIETLRALTGGVPRTIALMFRIFVDYEHESSIRDLERILDAVTPLYKHRMDDLPTQQQKIIDAVAKQWDPISVKDLRVKVRLDSKTISSQLRQLEKNQVIEKRETGTKNHLYLLKERFFNIWYLMRHGRKTDKQRVVWLVRFFENFYTNTEIETKIDAFIQGIKEKRISDDIVDFFSYVYSSLQNLTPQSKALLKYYIPEDIGSEINLDKHELAALLEELLKREDFKDLQWLSTLDWPHLLEDLFTWHDPLTITKMDFVIHAWVLLFFQRITGDVKDEKIAYRFFIGLALLTHLDVRFEEKPSTLFMLVIRFMSYMISHSMLNTMLLLFEDPAYSQSITGVVIDLKTPLEPIYQSLLIVANRLDYTQIPPEKEQLIRNIVTRITSKDE